MLLLPCHVLFTTHHMLQCINRPRQMCSCLCKNRVSIGNFLFIPLCASFLDYSLEPQRPLSYLGPITHCFLSIYGNKSKWRQISEDFEAHHSPSLCVQREASFQYLPFPCIFFPFSLLSGTGKAPFSRKITTMFKVPLNFFNSSLYVTSYGSFSPTFTNPTKVTSGIILPMKANSFLYPQKQKKSRQI